MLCYVWMHLCFFLFSVLLILLLLLFLKISGGCFSIYSMYFWWVCVIAQTKLLIWFSWHEKNVSKIIFFGEITTFCIIAKASKIKTHQSAAFGSWSTDFFSTHFRWGLKSKRMWRKKFFTACQKPTSEFDVCMCVCACEKKRRRIFFIATTHKDTHTKYCFFFLHILSIASKITSCNHQHRLIDWRNFTVSVCWCVLVVGFHPKFIYTNEKCTA